MVTKNKNLKTKKPRVYLAGQITNNRWRGALCLDRQPLPGERRIPGETVICVCEDEYLSGESDFGSFIVTGPHSLGCDHGCFHMLPSRHCATTEREGMLCTQDYGFDRGSVSAACLGQIYDSDIVFAYIESLTAYGTIAEIGYARGNYKTVVILFENKSLADELWFVAEMADIVLVQESEDKVYEIRKAFSDSLFHLGYRRPKFPNCPQFTGSIPEDEDNDFFFQEV